MELQVNVQNYSTLMSDLVLQFRTQFNLRLFLHTGFPDTVWSKD